MRFYLFILSALFLFPAALKAQTADKYLQEWKAADSLLYLKLPQSATAVVQAVYDRAKTDRDEIYQLKAALYLMYCKQQDGKNKDRSFILMAQQELKNAKFPVKNIWHSLLAGLYWKIYRADQYNILKRTQVAGPAQGTGIDDWDASSFFKTITAHYAASLKGEEKLMKINAESYTPVVLKGNQSLNFRPTLYDLLAFGAINYYISGDAGITQHDAPFQLDTTNILSDAQTFSGHRYQSQDTFSLKLRALKMYQQIIRNHLHDSIPDVLLDADLDRLKFEYQNAGSIHKDLYKQALQFLIDKYPTHPLGGVAKCRYLALTYNLEGNWSRPYAADDTTDLIKLENEMSAIVQFYGQDSEAGFMAGQWLKDILFKTVNLTIERNIPSTQANRILVRYRNIPEVSFKVVALPDGVPDSLFADTVKALPAIYSWQERLPAAEDHKNHSTEVKLDALSPGKYAIQCTEHTSATKDKPKRETRGFQITDIAIITQGSSWVRGVTGYVVNRQTGQPIARARITASNEEDEKDDTYVTANDGRFSINGVHTISSISASLGVHFTKVENPNSYDESNKADTAIFFFTDRSIYRPGQTVEYKGICMHQTNKYSDWEILPGWETNVSLTSPDDQEVTNQAVRTNEFGSFSGSFILPTNRPTGSWNMNVQERSAIFSVEEYKRPVFEVYVDTLLNARRMDDSVKVLVRAISFSGMPVADARISYKIKYNVTSSIFNTTDNRSMSYNINETVAADTLRTDSLGCLILSFKAIAHPGITANMRPIYRYKISVEVTDSKGESHAQEKEVRLGHHITELKLYDASRFNGAEKSVFAYSADLEYTFKPAQVRLSAALLRSPDKFYYPSKWERPDQFVMTSDTFRKYFPNDEYGDENEYQKWLVKQHTLDTTFFNAYDRPVALGKRFFPENGRYRLIASHEEEAGIVVKDTLYVIVTDPTLPGRLLEPLLLLSKDTSGKKGPQLSVKIQSSFPDAHFLFQEANSSRVINKILHNEKGGARYSRNLSVPDNKGIWIGACLMQHNHFFKSDYRLLFDRQTYIDLHVKTHRNKILPGSLETWTLQLRGKAKEYLDAEVVATLYDGSLEHLQKHDWQDNFYMNENSTLRKLWRGNIDLQDYAWRYPTTVDNNRYWSSGYAYGSTYRKKYDEILALSNTSRWSRKHQSYKYWIQDDIDPLIDAKKPGGRVTRTSESMILSPGAEYTPFVEDTVTATTDKSIPKNIQIPMRKNMKETAFFLPHLRTDSNGRINITFTIPEALTKWKFMAWAHTKDLRTAFVTDSVYTQKPLMIQPSLPRFFQQGDRLTITANISNVSDKAANGMATIDFADPNTGRNLNSRFQVQNREQPFPINQSSSVSWDIKIPDSFYTSVIIRTTANSGNFTDGEEHLLPILSNKTLITETLPLWMDDNGKKQYQFRKLLYSDTCSTLSQHSLTVEYTANPAWVIFQSLPSLMEYPYDCAEQTFNRYYANTLAERILDKAPRINELFAKWAGNQDTTIPVNDLRANPELKSMIAEEMPWLTHSNSAPQQRKHIATLFDSNRMDLAEEKALNKLEQIQLPDHSFPWFSGMTSNRYITQYIAIGLQKLYALGVRDPQAQKLNSNVQQYLNKAIRADYEHLLKDKVALTAKHLHSTQIQMLYNSSFNQGSSIDTGARTAFNFYKEQAKKFWPDFNPQLRAMIALSLYRLGDTSEVPVILQSLRETAINNEETGMYWKHNQGTAWEDAPIESHCVLIECFSEAGTDTAMIRQMKKWLIQQKQVRDWHTTKATADACYALLLSGGFQINNHPAVHIQLGEKLIRSDAEDMGAGYFKQSIPQEDIRASMGNVSISISATAPANVPGYGALYWQYMEQTDKITNTTNTPLSVQKEIYAQYETTQIPLLAAIDNHRSILKKGDKVIVRLIIKTDRDIDYVHLKDTRPACFEPLDILSGYYSQNGISYYRSTRDASSNFFFDHLKKGTYIIEYPAAVMTAGYFTKGIATIQSMYAPTFSGHSSGGRIKVK